MPRLYLGLDSSTQSLTAIVLEVEGDRARLVLDTSLNFDDDLPAYGTRNGVLPGTDPSVACSSPLLWADALDAIVDRIARSGLQLARIAALSGSAQQHGSVYLEADAAHALGRLDPARAPGEQVRPLLSRPVAPIWMDTSTTTQCAELSAALGGPATLARRTGSRAFERFTGPQIRKFAATDPDAYRRTARIHLVSSYLASLLIGRDAPVDPGDASGTNLMDLASRTWWRDAVVATAPGLADRLPVIAASWSVAGTLSPYWQIRHGLPAAKVITWSGDNPSSLIGVGLVREGLGAISLGTSDTIFGLMQEPRVADDGTGHVFGSPTGEYMGLTCFANGSLARERIRATFGLRWDDFSRLLEATPPGNAGRVLVPWFVPEITPPVFNVGVHRYRLASDDGPGNVRAVVEGQLMAMALHSRWMGVAFDTIQATGGAAVNEQILRVMADVFGAEVRRSTVTNSAALGAALRAWHGDMAASGSAPPWDAIIGGFEQPPAARVLPDAAAHDRYCRLMPIYEQCEQHALGRGGDPSRALERFARE